MIYGLFYLTRLIEVNRAIKNKEWFVTTDIVVEIGKEYHRRVSNPLYYVKLEKNGKVNAVNGLKYHEAMSVYVVLIKGIFGNRVLAGPIYSMDKYIYNDTVL